MGKQQRQHTERPASRHDGYETTQAVNFVGSAALTAALLRLVRHSPHRDPHREGPGLDESAPSISARFRTSGMMFASPRSRRASGRRRLGLLEASHDPIGNGGIRAAAAIQQWNCAHVGPGSVFAGFSFGVGGSIDSWGRGATRGAARDRWS
jgi:hypothetical protein